MVKKKFEEFISALRNPDRNSLEKLQTLVSIFQRKVKTFKRIRIMLKQKTPRFTGWGMTSKHALPWDQKNSTDKTGLKFSEVESDLKKLLRDGEFVLTQFQTNSSYIEDPSKYLTHLSWRHYLVYWSAMLATRFTKTSSYNFVEAGTCDGLTIKFAISALENETDRDTNYKIYLYDSWDAMKLEHLTTKESGAEGHYSYLSIDQTKGNLKQFEEHCEFVKGYIPEVFSENPGPDSLSWLHIDLNSSMPTQKTLEQFVPKLLSGGVVLFDDYGHRGYSETKKVADEFFSEKDGILMPLPTGQAIFFKR